MNIKSIYIAGGVIAAVAIVIFLIMGPLGLNNGSNTFQKQGFNQNSSIGAQPPIKLSIKNISAKQIGNKTADLQIAFNAHNPNKGTIILEAITYNLFANDIRLASGDIGAKLEGFVTSQEGVFPIIGNSTVTLKDTKPVHQNRLIADSSWNKIIDGKANYVINGTYSYKQTSSLQSTGEDKYFKLTFP
jgi:hypothetical protein